MGGGITGFLGIFAKTTRLEYVFEIKRTGQVESMVRRLLGIITGLVLLSVSTSGAQGQNLMFEWNVSSPTGWAAAPHVADLDFNRRDEILVIEASTPPVLHCIQFDGAERWAVPLKGSVGVGLAVGDVDGDSRPDVVACASGTVKSWALAFDRDGNKLWEAELKGRCNSVPVLADIDGDGRDEVLVVDEGRGLLCLEGMDGSVRWNIPKRSPATSFVAVADVNRTGRLQVIWLQNLTGSIWVVDPVSQGVVKTLNGSADSSFFGWPALGDLDADGYLELVVGGSHSVLCIDLVSLTQRWKVDTPSKYSIALGDIDGDGYLDVIVPGKGRVVCIDRFGSVTYESQLETQQWMGSVVVGDVDGDGTQEILTIGDQTDVLYGLNGRSGLVEFSIGSKFGDTFDGATSCTISDGDGDRKAEVYCSSSGGSNPSVYCLGSEKPGWWSDWPQLLHDPANTANYETPIVIANEDQIAMLMAALAALFAGQSVRQRKSLAMRRLEGYCGPRASSPGNGERI